jgi:type-F conjugative transfer system secretin TraK
MRKLIGILLIYLGLLPAVWAMSTLNRAHAPVIHYQNFDTVTITLSSTDLNTIVFKQNAAVEKIADLMGGANVYHAERDSMGQVYLTVNAASPFTLFVTTHQHHHLALHITPGEVQGQTMVFEYSDLTSTHHKPSIKKKNTVVSIQTRLKQLATQKLPSSFHRIKTTQRVQKLTHRIQLQPIQTYSNGKVRGVIYALQNTSSSPQRINVHQLLQPNVLGVRLNKRSVPAHGAIWCYRWEKNQ